jgi:hypothetical protein
MRTRTTTMRMVSYDDASVRCAASGRAIVASTAFLSSPTLRLRALAATGSSTRLDHGVAWVNPAKILRLRYGQDVLGRTQVDVNQLM